MARDKRMVDDGGRPIPFTCQNYGFETNIEKGEPHRPNSNVRGSVFAEPLIDHDGYSLWIEHVRERQAGGECYWLMWYDNEGIPTIPLSGVFDRGDLESMVARLARLVP